LKEEEVVDRPLCKCGYPSEVKISKDKEHIYFVCALKNVWGDFYEGLQVDEPCDFWKIYEGDKELKQISTLNKIHIKAKWLDRIPSTNCSIEPGPCVSCRKEIYYPIWALGYKRKVCQRCLAFNYSQLEKEYSKPKPLFVIDDE
jgi:hypothetical protein